MYTIGLTIAIIGTTQIKQGEITGWGIFALSVIALVIGYFYGRKKPTKNATSQSS